MSVNLRLVPEKPSEFSTGKISIYGQTHGRTDRKPLSVMNNTCIKFQSSRSNGILIRAREQNPANFKGR